VNFGRDRLFRQLLPHLQSHNVGNFSLYFPSTSPDGSALAKCELHAFCVNFTQFIQRLPSKHAEICMARLLLRLLRERDAAGNKTHAVHGNVSAARVFVWALRSARLQHALAENKRWYDAARGQEAAWDAHRGLQDVDDWGG
jgi:hypothetical protein